MGVAVAAEDVFQRRIHHPYNLLPVDALVSIDSLEWGGIDDEQLQMGSKAIDDGVVDVLVAEAVANHHQPSRWSCEHSAKPIMVPGRNRKAAYADGFCTAHDDDALAAIGLYPIHGTVEFHVRLRAAPGPQGTRLIGTYDSQIAAGQSRVLLVWTRLIMPSGRSIVLERQPGADAEGYAGLQDDVDRHWSYLFRAAMLSTLLGIGAEFGFASDVGNADNSILQALRRGGGSSLNQTGQQIVRRNLNVQPTLTIRPGFAVRVVVNRGLVLESYRG